MRVEDGEAGRHEVTLESDHLVRQREAMCVSVAKAIHQKKAFLFFMRWYAAAYAVPKGQTVLLMRVFGKF